MKARRRFAVVAVLAGCALLTAACSSTPQAAPQVPRVFDLTGESPVTATDQHPPIPQATLQLVLESLFEWHGLSLTYAMRTTVADAPGRDGWIDALAGNADDIANAVALVYGRPAGEAFRQQWAQHAQFLVDYAAARRVDDGAGMALAREHLAAYERDNGLFLSKATGGRLPADVVEGLLRDHVDRMIAQLDHAAAGRVDDAAVTALSDHGYLTSIADALAPAMAAASPATVAAGDPADAVFCSVASRAIGAYAYADLDRLTGGGVGKVSPAAETTLTDQARKVDAALAPVGVAWGTNPNAYVPAWATWAEVARNDPDRLAPLVKQTLATAGEYVQGLPTPSL